MLNGRLTAECFPRKGVSGDSLLGQAWRGGGMIFFVATERFSNIVTTLLRNIPVLRKTIRSLSYEELFFERAGPVEHYIFSDFDRLSRYELDSAGRFATALRRVSSQAKILNHPAHAMERTALLLALHEAGINDFMVTRLDPGVRPSQYPVFIRADDGYDGPETDLIFNDAEFDCAVRELGERGLPLRGRVAIGFAAEKGSNGRYRKYGAFNIGGRIIPQHLMQSDHWVIKRHVPEVKPAAGLDESEPNVDEEMEFVRNNPHRDVLLTAFQAGHIDFGRADYALVGGKVQIYEINTNPAFPRFDIKDHRSERREFLKQSMVDAFEALDTPLDIAGRVRFEEARPRAHALHLPRFRLPVSVLRRLCDALPTIRRKQQER
jgi:hypothetical protein